MKLDHLAVQATSLEEGVDHVEAALGVRLSAGGQHPLMGTHNRLLGMGREYFEVIAIDPNAPAPKRARWFDMDRFNGGPRLTNWIVAVEDMKATLDQMPTAAGQPIALSRGDLSWQMAVPDNGILPFDGIFPAIISWMSDLHPAGMLEDKGVRLMQLNVSHPDAGDLRALLAPLAADARIAFHKGSPALQAEFSTPNGKRILE